MRQMERVFVTTCAAGGAEDVRHQSLKQTRDDPNTICCCSLDLGRVETDVKPNWVIVIPFQPFIHNLRNTHAAAE